MAGSNHGGSAIDGVDVAAIRRYLAETDVRFAILFGSRARGETHDSSDVDVALQFPEELSPKNASVDGTASIRISKGMRTISST